ncbi:Gfo/Idh/MocA family protein [Pseudomonas sp. R1-7]|uniref:Gfo/Idh/MocA family protein n=1 Tax=Pseudomonas sp. R1-7 TaxID=2817398 RepID=UPI003DA9D468
MNIRAVVVGVGNSGSRFIQASHFIDSSIGKIDIVGIADTDDLKVKALLGAGIVVERDFRKLLGRVSFDIIIISTTDNAHYEILKYIKENNIPFKKIICEKPIVLEAEQCQFVERSFKEDQIYVNFVERYSSAVSELKQFIERKGRNVSSASFVWSKYRIKDARPTVGVTSEITHPVDLACYVAGVDIGGSLRGTSSSICESDFALGGGLRPETMLACVDFVDGMLLTGTSSYVRSERCRTMEFLLSDTASQVTEIAVLRLDSPRWDDDYLDIYSVVPGASQLDLSFSYTASKNNDGARRHIEKICRFLEDVVSSIDGRGSSKLPTKSQALLVQGIVQKLAAGHVVGRKMFSDDAPAPLDNFAHLKKLAELISSGTSEVVQDVWDDQY